MLFVKFTNKLKGKVNESDHDMHERQLRPEEENVLPRVRPGEENEPLQPQVGPGVENEPLQPQIGPGEENEPLQPQDIEAGPLEPSPIPNQATSPARDADRNLRYPVRHTRRPPHLDDYIVNDDLDDNDLI